MLFTNSHARSANSFALAKQAANWLSLLQNIPVMLGTDPQTHPARGVHFQNQHPGITIPPSHSVFAAVSIVAGERDRTQRKLREAVEIQHQKPEVNLNAAWSLI